MKFKKTVVAIFIMAPLVAATPYVSGILAEKKIRFMIDKMSKLTQNKIKIKSYAVGWLASRLTVSVKKSKDINISISHGPVVATAKGMQFASALIQYRSPIIKKLFPKNIKSLSDDTAVEMVFNFTKDTILSIQSKSLKINMTTAFISNQAAEAPHFSISNIKLSLPITDDAKSNGMTGGIGSILVNIEGLSVRTDKVKINSVYKRSPKGLTIGKDNWTIGSMIIKASPTLKLSFNKIVMTALADMKDSMVQYDIRLKAGKSQVNKHQVNNIVYTLNMNNLDDQATTELQNLEEKIAETKGTGSVGSLMKLMSELLTRFFSTSPGATSGIEIAMPSGKVMINATVTTHPILFKGGPMRWMPLLAKALAVSIKGNSNPKTLTELARIWFEIKGTKGATAKPAAIVTPADATKSLQNDSTDKTVDATGDATSKPDNASKEIPVVKILTKKEEVTLAAKAVVTNLLTKNIIIKKGGKYHAEFSYKNGKAVLNGQSLW